MKSSGRRFFIILFLVFSIAGCAGKNKKDLDTVTVWHWMSDRDEAFQELAKKFEEETHIRVEFELYAPSEVYAQRVKASAQTNTLPDIYGILGEKQDFASFIKSGHVADLSSELSVNSENGTWKSKFFEKALAVNQFLPNNEYGVPPGIYGVPLDVSTIQMIYNKALFKMAGLDPDKRPVTWEDFLKDCQILQQNGIQCFVSGFGEIWMIDVFASNYAMNIMGEQKVFDTYAGKVPYTDPDWIKVLSLFKEMADRRILVQGAVTMVNKSAEQVFANERAAFAFNGSWSVNVYKGMNPGLDYGAMLPPRISDAHPMKIWGVTGSSFVVNDRSVRKASAIRFLKWLTMEEQQATLAGQTENLPANKKSIGKISQILSEFADDMDNATHPNLYPVHEDHAVIEAFDKGIQSILIGEKTPEAIAQEVEKVKEKTMAKNMSLR